MTTSICVTIAHREQDQDGGVIYTPMSNTREGKFDTAWNLRWSLTKVRIQMTFSNESRNLTNIATAVNSN